MGPRSRISRSICGRRDNRLASLASLGGGLRGAGDGAVLRGADKHFDEVVVQRVVDLALEVPGELGVIEVAGMDLKLVGMHGDGRVLQIDQDLYDAVRFPRRESQQGMIVEPQVGADLFQFCGVRHPVILLKAEDCGGQDARRTAGEDAGATGRDLCRRPHSGSLGMKRALDRRKSQILSG